MKCIPSILLLFPFLTSGFGALPVSASTPPRGEREPTIQCAIPPHERGSVACVAFSPDGKTLAAGVGEGMVRYYDLGNLPVPPFDQERASFQVRDFIKGGVNQLTYSPDGKTLAAGLGLGEVALLDSNTGRVRVTLVHRSTFPNQAHTTALAYSPDGKTVAAGDHSGEVALWDAATGEKRLVLPAFIIPAHRIGIASQRQAPAHPAAVIALAFTPDGTTLASSSGRVRLWDPGTGQQRPWPKLNDDSPAAIVLAFSPDGKTLAAGGASKFGITLWDTATGLKRADLATTEKVFGPYDRFHGLAFLPGGRRLVTLEGDRILRLWDAAGGPPISGVRSEEHSWLTSLAVSPDGQLVAAGGFSSTGIFGVIELVKVEGTRLRFYEPKRDRGYSGKPAVDSGKKIGVSSADEK